MDLSRLCIHTETVKPLSLEEVARKFASHGIQSVSVWRHTLEVIGPANAGKMFRDHGIDVVSSVRGGFFPSADPAKRREAIDQNKEAIEEAAELAAPLLVLVCGADPQQHPDKSREQITEALEKLLPFAAQTGVKLGIEPLHPMYADTRSVINTLKQANNLAERFDSPWLGVCVCPSR